MMNSKEMVRTVMKEFLYLLEKGRGFEGYAEKYVNQDQRFF